MRVWRMDADSETGAGKRAMATGRLATLYRPFTLGGSKAGVAPDRLIFAPRLPKAEHLERHRLADVFLDTFIVNAHTTASDALWAGLPVLTLPGRNFQARVCISLLSALGLQGWVVSDEKEYEKQAVELAHDPEQPREWRARLAEHCRSYPLFSTEYFAKQIEQSFLAMWHEHAQNNHK